MAAAAFTRAFGTSALIGAIDQGTSSSRFLIFNADTGAIVAHHQIELTNYYPNEGWVEMNPTDIVNTTITCMEEACKKLQDQGFKVSDIRAIGITNQRETTVVWNRITGEPLHNAIVWLDTRTQKLADEYTMKAPGRHKDAWKEVTGLPIHPYFSALKIRWFLDNVPEVKKAAQERLLYAGTIDTWLIWKLTNGQCFVTDVTNASRTNLMNIHTLKWDRRLTKFYGIDEGILPEIRSSSEVYGKAMVGSMTGIPIAGCLGDQQAAMVGEGCLKEGEAKSTYGTGAFMLMNTGMKASISKHGLLTTVGYKLGPNAPIYYALEGSVAVAGGVIRWLRDQLNVVHTSPESEVLARSVKDTGDVYFVPAFSGLYAPYWHSKARGVICGLTQFTSKAHIVRAALESTCFQTREIVDAMVQDTGLVLKELKVDGGMTQNTTMMQLMADILGKRIVRLEMMEATSLGAAAAAGLAVNVWKMDLLVQHGTISTKDVFTPEIKDQERGHRYAKWKEAVKRSMNWVNGEHVNGAPIPCQFSPIGTSFIAGVSFGVLATLLASFGLRRVVS